MKIPYKSKGPTLFIDPPTKYVQNLIYHPPLKWTQYINLPADVNTNKEGEKPNSNKMSRIHMMMNEHPVSSPSDL